MSDAILTEEREAETNLNRLKPYDFRQPKLVSKEIIRSIRNIHEMYARNAKRIFAQVLNHNVEVTLTDVEQVIFSKYLNDIDPPSALFLFNIEELGDWAVMQMDPGFCIYCIERQSGGEAKYLEEKRILTRVEERIVGRIVEKCFKDLSHVWSSFFPFTVLNHIYESKPGNIRTISANDPGIVIRFWFKIDEFRVPFSICYPYALLKDQLISNSFNMDKANFSGALSSIEKKNFEEDLKQAEITIKVLLGETDVSLNRLIELKQGDVIMLNQQIDDPLRIMINNRIKMNGYPGSMRGKKAIKIYNIRKNSNDRTDL